MTPALEVEALTMAFGGVNVANALSLTLEPGDRVGLIGPNGAGKTSFVNLVTGAIKPAAGRIRLGGIDVTGLAPEARVRRGLVRSFQISRLFAGFSSLEHLELAIRIRTGGATIFSRRAAAGPVRAEACDRLAALGLDADADRPVEQLPYGRQRLVELALALALEPKVLLLDEPAAGVAGAERPLIEAALAALPAGLAVIMIDHDIDLVFRFARRVVVLASGQIIADAPPEAIRADARVRAAYLGSSAHGG